MNGALIIPAAPVSPRERMTTVLGALAFGLTPPFSCGACRDSAASRCDKCAQAVADVETVSEAITAIDDAPDDAAAERAFWDCLGALTGLVAEGGNW